MPDNIINQYLDQHDYITLDYYMNLCLQNHESGYYKTGQPIGIKGDFITAPEISQIFGELIGIFIQFHKATLFPDTYQICELGAGKGSCAKDYLRVIEKSVPPKDIFFLESNIFFKEIQKKHIPTAKHINSLNQLPARPTLFIANEFFDALPIKAFKIAGAEQAELIIRRNQHQNLYFDYAPTSKNKHLQIKGFIEESEQTINFCQQISDHINQHHGAGLFCDYGYFESPNKLTFRGFHNHKVTDGLQSPTQEDLTADVNFKHIMNCFFKQNLNVSNLCSQADFLKAMHIEARLHKLLGMVTNKQLRETLIQGVQKLISPSQMGDRFKFLSITQINTPLYPFSNIYRPS